MKKTGLVLKNIFYSFGTRVIILILGFVLPRLLITSFGSEVNGLLSTVTQIFTYLALLEAGIGNSAVNALYKPLQDKNYGEACEVVNEAKLYFRKVSIIYGACILAFGIIYPFCTSSSLSKITVFWIIFLQGLSSFIGYYFSAVYTHLLTADGKRYINENISFFTYVVSSVLKIILIMSGFGVISVQLGFVVISVIKAPLLYYVCKHRYTWLGKKINKDKRYLKERGAFVVHEISGTIFNSTDVFLISTFCSFTLASVYTVYNLVYSSLNTLLSTANGGLGFILGQGQYGDSEEFVNLYDLYSMVYTCVAFIIFTIAYVLIKPFVTIYTQGVTDVNYLIPGMAILFTLINLLSCIRATGSLLITVSGHADKTKHRSIAEAVINLISSIVFVNVFQVRGVLLGTIVALLYRSNDIIIYANRQILKRSSWKEYRRIACCFLTFLLVVISTNFWKINISSIKSFILWGGILSIFITLLFVLVNLLTNIPLIQYWMRKYKK